MAFNDKLWLEQFLKRRVNTQKSLTITSNKKAPISNLKISIIKCNEVLNKLKHSETKLRSDVNELCEDEWNRHLQEIEDLKKLLLHIYEDLKPNKLKSVLNKINKRKVKRLSARQKFDCKLNGDIRKEKHLRIDDLIAKIKNDQELMKQSEKKAEDAKAVLHNVQTKISEAKRWLDTMEALCELRRVRLSAACAHGAKDDTAQTLLFKQTIDQLTEIWNSALQRYYKEKEELQGLISENNKKLGIERGDLVDQEFRDWFAILFGSEQQTPSELIVAENDINKFIQIRQCWDQYIVPEHSEAGSKIPIGWVIPPTEPKIEAWKAYLQK